MCTQIKKQVGIILKKTASVPEKSHQANQSIDLLVQHEKNSVKNCYCAAKKKKKNECAYQKWTKFCEKLSLCNETKEEKKKTFLQNSE